MDTTKLAVSQKVFAMSGVYFSEGEVTKVTQDGVEVHFIKNPLPGKDIFILRFDTKGISLDKEVGTAEYGPYTIDESPFEKREAWLLQRQKDGVLATEDFKWVL